MDEMTMLKDLRASTPEITPVAEQAARHHLMRATREPVPAPHRGFHMPRMAWRVAAAGALAVGIATGVTVAQNVGVGNKSPGRHGVLPGGSVANAQELSDRAARAAENGSATAGPNQWTYVKWVEAGISEYQPGVTRERTTFERWINFDGKQIKIVNQRGVARKGNVSPGFANPSRLSTNPDTLLRQLYALAAEDRAPGTTREQNAFWTIRGIMKDTAPPPRLQAALYRVLPKISGVTLQRDAIDAAGRHGIAFAIAVENGRDRDEIILDSGTYRYLGSRTIAVRDYTEKNVLKPRVWTPGNSDGEDAHVKAGTVLDWSAQLAKAVVDKSGQRP
jgi:hypothetical protein